MLWLLLVIFVLSFVYLLSMEWRGRHLPPGVRGIRAVALMGRMLRDGADVTHAYINQRYGDIASLQLGSKTIIFLGTHQLLKEAFSKPEITDRPTTTGRSGLVGSNGKLWKEQRRFALSTLRDFGMGKNVQEDRIIDECMDLIHEFGKHQNSFDPKFYLGCAVTNVICAIIFSDRFRYGDPTLTHFLDMVTDNLSTPHRRLAELLPFGRYLPRIRTTLANIEHNRTVISNIVRGYVHQHKETYREGDIRDFIDAYLSVIQNESGKEHTTFTEEQLIKNVHDLFVAGSETTGTTLRWSLALMALHSTTQDLVHDEIMSVVGKDRTVNMTDRVNMPYTEAVLLEIQRFGSVVPSVPHKANANTTLGSYAIEKGYSVFVNINQLNKDPRIWPHPHEFNVNNFLHNGEVVNRNYFISFSVGKRSCLGESLAKMELFLFFVSLIQKFHFYFDVGEEVDLNRAESGIIRMPPPYKIRIQERK